MNSPTQWDEQANILNETINNCSKTKPLVFVFHSFGTYIASSYFHLFPHDRIIGLIDIGGAPIRFNPYLQ
jgi:pimeloyl-ACP methyl ester carboxylesterase